MFNINLKVSAATCGKFDRKNQDNMLVDKFITNVRNVSQFSSFIEVPNGKESVFCVSDGIGGVRGGDYASEKTVSAVWENIVTLRTCDNIDTIYSCLDLINGQVVECLEDKGYCGGATLSGVIINNTGMWYWNIGDSPIYLVRNKKIRELSEEHTLAKCKNNKKTYASNVLTKYIGNYEETGGEQAKIDRLDLKQDDMVIICTDGVIKGLTERNIKNILLKNKNEHHLADELVNAAKEHGADDDITAIVIKVRKEDR